MRGASPKRLLKAGQFWRSKLGHSSYFILNIEEKECWLDEPQITAIKLCKSNVSIWKGDYPLFYQNLWRRDYVKLFE